MREKQRPYQAIVLGASAGGLQAISSLVSALPQPFSLPLIVCVHLQASRRLDLGAAFRASAGFTWLEAEEKQKPEAGFVYVAPSGYHLLLERDLSFSLSNESAVNWARPSIDVLFETAADAYGDSLIGVLLTGANADGAAGLQAIRQRGGLTIVQDPEEAEVPSMPRAAIAKGPIAHILPLMAIAQQLSHCHAAACR